MAAYHVLRAAVQRIAEMLEGWLAWFGSFTWTPMGARVFRIRTGTDNRNSLLC